MSKRKLQTVIESVPASDGAGVKLRRSLGGARNLRIDPFLMLDEFYSDDPDDYIAGFPSHPHRGFETVTYMLDGHMRHEDSFGNRGDLGPGDVQWMTAAHGIIHSEMPQQTEGRMRGFQLWINLPARDKMKRAAWRDVPSSEIPTVGTGGWRAGTRDRRHAAAGNGGDGAVPSRERAPSPSISICGCRPEHGSVFRSRLPTTHSSTPTRVRHRSATMGAFCLCGPPGFSRRGDR
jgi:redox-sensitive bicupin YhaK (pirin superfamily)